MLGTIVHRALARLHKYADDLISVSLEEILAYHDTEWNGLNRDTLAVSDENYAVDDYIKLGRRMLEEYFRRYQPFNQRRLISVERRMSFTLPETSFKFIAIIDRLSKAEDGIVEICDYKTGRNPMTASDPDFLHQMGLYQLAVREAFPQIERIVLAQYWLRSGEVISCEMSDEQLDLLTEQLRQGVIETINAERLDDFPTRKGPLCRFCDFAHLCPAMRHKLQLEEDEESTEDSLTPAQEAAQVATRYIEANDRYKLARSEVESLKEQVVQLADDMGVDALEGEGGSIKVRSSLSDKFVTKSEDETEFADLNAAARRLGFDEYFKLDTNAFMKEMYQKQRLTPEQVEALKPFVRERKEIRVTVKRSTPDNESGE